MSLCRLTTVLLLTVLSGCQVATTTVPPEMMSTPGPTGVAGQVLAQHGGPVADTYVYAYRNTRSQLRGPADFAARVTSAGGYFLDLVEGEYYLVARQRKGRADSGPPRAGDAWALYLNNPVVVRPGHTSQADFRIRITQRPMAQGKGVVDSGTRLSGQVVDAQNRPVVGAIVLAYADDDLRRMPDAVSPATDESGRFVLSVSAGRVCLAARVKSRGQPQPGELYGLYAGEDQSPCLSVEVHSSTEVGQIVLVPYRQ